MSDYFEPFADELLSSWIARRRRGQALPAHLEPRAYRNAKGLWRHPDIRPQPSWLRALAEHFDIDVEQIGSNAVFRRYPLLDNRLTAWGFLPPSYPVPGGTHRPILCKCWCSQCLAEDYAAGRPAYVRADWVVTTFSFCPSHHWPLFDRCSSCGSAMYQIVRPPRGPQRMFCCNCHRSLERANPKALELEPTARGMWGRIASFEAQLRRALAGQVPNQFRFNNTSATQLLGETVRICVLLACCSARRAWHDLLYERFANDTLTLGQVCSDYLDCAMPLALADLPLRRCLLAISAAILDRGFEPIGASSQVSLPTIDVFAKIAQDYAVDDFLEDRTTCSPTLAKQVGSARVRNAQRTRIWALRQAIGRLDHISRESV